MIVSPEEVTDRLPEQVTPLTEHETRRLVLFLDDARELIAEAFAREHRDLDTEIATSPWLGGAVARVIREMVAAAVIIGPNINVRSASSTTGPQSDSVSYEKTNMVSFAGPRLTDDLRKALDLAITVRAHGQFPASPRWPEVRLP